MKFNLRGFENILAREDLLRIGRAYDGGYVMVDDFDNCVAYSFGISDDVSWDFDIAKRGIDVYMYDHTIDSLPVYDERFHFFKTTSIAIT